MAENTARGVCFLLGFQYVPVYGSKWNPRTICFLNGSLGNMMTFIFLVLDSGRVYSNQVKQKVTQNEQKRRFFYDSRFVGFRVLPLLSRTPKTKTWRVVFCPPPIAVSGNAHTGN